MNRSTLTSAIRLGIRKSSGKPLEDQVGAVLDCIDMAVELEGSHEEILTAPRKPAAGAPAPVPVEPPPFNPDSVVSAETQERPKEPSLIVMPTDAETDEVIEQHHRKNELRVKSLYLGASKAKVTLMNVMEWAAISFPVQIQVTPKGVDKPITLERNLGSIPCSGEGRNKEIESTVKVKYKHPAFGSDMEVGESIRVGDVQDGWPDKAEMLARLSESARELYKRRPAMIQGAAPSGPDMYQAHRMAATAFNTRQQPAMPIALADADMSARPDLKVVE